MHLTMELTVDAAGRFEGTIDSDSNGSSSFSGTLELLKVLEDVVRAHSESEAGHGSE